MRNPWDVFIMFCTPGVRTADARSEGIVELYKLTCPDFEELSQYYPEIVDFFRTVATVRCVVLCWSRPEMKSMQIEGSLAGCMSSTQSSECVVLMLLFLKCMKSLHSAA